MTKILMVLSSAAKTVTGKDAGYYLPEAAHVSVYAFSCLPGARSLKISPLAHDDLAVLLVR